MSEESPASRAAHTSISSAITIALALLPPLLFAAFVFHDLRSPGFFGDEAWAAVPAMKLVQGAAVVDGRAYGQAVILGKAIPWMTHDYVGPIQALYLAAAFLILGVSAETVRIATSVAGLLTVCLTYLIGSRLGLFAGFAAATLLATDLGFQLLSRHDYGTAIVGLLLQTLAIWLLLLWTEHQRRWPLLAAGMFLLGLALTYKSNLLTIVVAAPLSFAIVYGNAIKSELRVAATSFLALLAGAWPILLFNVLTGGATFREPGTLAWSQPLLPRTADEAMTRIAQFPAEVADRLHRIGNLLAGTSPARTIVREPFAEGALFGGSLLPHGVVIGTALLVLLALPRFRDLRRPAGFLLLTALVSLLLIAAAPMTRMPYHMLLIYPFPHLLAAAGLLLLWRLFDDREERLARVSAPVSARLSARVSARLSALALLVLILASNVSLAISYRQSLDAAGGKGNFSEAIYALDEVLERSYSDRAVQMLDWGVWHPLMILKGGDFLSEQPFWRMLNADGDDAWLEELIRDPANVWIVRGESRLFLEPEKRFRRVAVEMGLTRVRETVIRDEGGDLAFAILDLHHDEWAEGQSGRRFAELAPRNLLVNPSFEKLDASGLPAGWTSDALLTVVRDAGSGEGARSGSNAVMAGVAGTWQSVPVAGGGDYVLGHFTRSAGKAGWARLQVNFVGEKGEPAGVSLKLVPATRSWRWHEMTMTAPEGAAAAAVYVQTHEQAEVWFDDVYFATER